RHSKLDTLALRDRCCVAGEPQPRRPVAATDDLDLAHSHAAQAKGLERSFLCGKTRGKVATRPSMASGVIALCLREKALGQARAPLERALDALDLDQVDADPRDRGHARTLLRRQRDRGPSDHEA